jgi:hypothetical protein
VSEGFAERIEALGGFEAYHALVCGLGEILTVSCFRDQSSAHRTLARDLRAACREDGRTQPVAVPVARCYRWLDLLRIASATGQWSL